jgi:hypothetical protein
VACGVGEKDTMMIFRTRAFTPIADYAGHAAGANSAAFS